MPNPAPESRFCPACGLEHIVQRLELSTHSEGRLPCERCGGELLKWSGHFFYTFGVAPKPSSAEIDVLDLPMARD